MANNLDAARPEYWSKRMQATKRKVLVSSEFANFEEQSNLTNWVKVHRPYFSRAKVRDYVRGTDTSAQDRTVTDEYLTIDQQKEITTYIDKLDEIQSNYNFVNTLVDDDAYQLAAEQDGRFFREIINASYSFDDWDIGWTSWTPITLTTSNVVQVFSKLAAKFRTNNIEKSRPWKIALTPNVASVIEQSFVKNGFSTADSTLKNGYAGDYMGFACYISNNVTHQVKLTNSGQPSDADTVTLTATDLEWTAVSVVFTFKTVLWATAGNVLIWGTASESYDNLVAAINGGSGAWTTYVALSTANRDALNNVGFYAVKDSATVVSVYSYGQQTVAESTANMTASSSISVLYASREWATDMVTQANVQVQQNKEPKKLGYSYITYDLYGLKTFAEWTKRMVKVNIYA